MAERNPFELGKNRIESLSDGLFAVAMTLLVLTIKLPTLPDTTQNVELTGPLLHLLPNLGTYAIAFVGLGVYWVLHHMVYHPVQAADRVLLWLNILFFLFISILPLGVQLINLFPNAQIAPVIFGANLAVAGWLLYLQWLYVKANTHLTDGRILTERYREEVGMRVLLAPIVATLTSLICFWSTAISVCIYLLMLPFYMVPGDAMHRHEAADRKPRRSRFALGWGLLVVLAGIGWAEFRPELLLVDKRVDEPLPVLSSAEPLAYGFFRGVAHATTGMATIFRRAGGGEVLRLNDVKTANGPDVHIFMVAAKDVRDSQSVTTAGYIDLGKMKGNLGNQNYDLPAGFDLHRYTAVTIWCDRFKVNFATAPLSGQIAPKG